MKFKKPHPCLKPRVINLMAALLFSIAAPAQSSFHKVFKTSAGSFEYMAMTTATDGNALIATLYNAGAGYGLSIQSVSPSGVLIMARTEPALTAPYAPVAMAATPDSGAVVALMDTTLSSQRMQLFKARKDGTTQWGVSFSANIAAIDRYPPAISVTQDGSMLVVYPHNNTVMLKKFGGGGNLVWERSYQPTNTSLVFPTAVQQVGAAIYVGGYDANSYMSFLMKTDTAGVIVWQKVGTGELGSGLRIIPVSGNSIIASSFILGSVADSKISLFHADGTVGWTKRVGMPCDVVMNVRPNAVAFASQRNGIMRAIIMDTLGNLIGSKSYRDSFASEKFAGSAAADGGFWLSSIRGNRLWVMKADAAGATPCYTFPDTLSAQPNVLTPTNLNLTSVAPGANGLLSFGSSPQPFSLSDSTICGALSASQFSKPDAVAVYPNPANDALTIRQGAGSNLKSYIVFDVSGRTIASGSIIASETRLQSGDWTPGLYFIHVADVDGGLLRFRIVRQ